MKDRFFTRAQKPGETVEQHATELRNRSETCEFGGLTDSLIKDRLVCGIPDNGLRERLKLNKDKCQLGVRELTFVGDILSGEGIRPDPRKVSAIENMPRPQCK